MSGNKLFDAYRLLTRGASLHLKRSEPNAIALGRIFVAAVENLGQKVEFEGRTTGKNYFPSTEVEALFR